MSRGFAVVLFGFVAATPAGAAAGDTPLWENGHGKTCKDYISNGWCSNGDFAPGWEWTGSSASRGGDFDNDCTRQITDVVANCGMVFNFPAENCVECGKITRAERLEEPISHEDRSLEDHGDHEHEEHGHHEESKKAMCGVDVAQATLSLGRAGMAVNAAVKSCTEVEKERKILDLAEEEEYYVGEADHRKLEGHHGGEKHEAKASCSAKVSEVLLSFTEVASFLAAAATNCAKTLHLGSICAADISGFVGACSVVARAGSGMQHACKNITASMEKSIAGLTRRLDDGPLPANDRCPQGFTMGPGAKNDISGCGMDGKCDYDKYSSIEACAASCTIVSGCQSFTYAAPGEDPNRKKQSVCARYVLPTANAEHGTQTFCTRKMDEHANEHAKEMKAECTFDVGQATMFLVRAGMAIHGAVKDCESFVIEHDEHGEHDNDHFQMPMEHRRLEETGPELIQGAKLAKRVCAIDVGGIIGSFSHAASFLAFAGSHCPGVSNLQAACSAEVLSVVGALSQFAAAGASFDLACGDRVHDSVEHLGERPYRRLVEDTAYVTV